jgi:hypothetical protein
VWCALYVSSLHDFLPSHLFASLTFNSLHMCLDTQTAYFISSPLLLPLPLPLSPSLSLSLFLSVSQDLLHSSLTPPKLRNGKVGDTRNQDLAQTWQLALIGRAQSQTSRWFDHSRLDILQCSRLCQCCDSHTC